MIRLSARLQTLRTLDPQVVDAVVAVVFVLLSVATVFGEDIRDADGLREGYREPSALALVSVVVTCAPIAFRRRWPLAALVVSAGGILIHLLIGWPEGLLPIAVLLITYSVGAWCPIRPALVGLAVVLATIGVLGVASEAEALDSVGVIGLVAQFTAIWTLGVAMRLRRAAADAMLRQADERAEAERQTAARLLAEQRLLIAQELHDVVAHSMSVIAVQAGVGAHVLDERPGEARAALEAISATSRGALTELRRLLGVLRDAEGARSHQPAPGLADLPGLVDDVRGVGVPVRLQLVNCRDGVPAGVELSAYRIVQEALTNVVKHAGRPTRVDVTVQSAPDAVSIEVVDDGRGLAAQPEAGDLGGSGSGQGLIGIRERVEMWGGTCSMGPAPGGGYRVTARIPAGGEP